MKRFLVYLELERVHRKGWRKNQWENRIIHVHLEIGHCTGVLCMCVFVCVCYRRLIRVIQWGVTSPTESGLSPSSVTSLCCCWCREFTPGMCAVYLTLSSW